MKSFAGLVLLGATVVSVANAKCQSDIYGRCGDSSQPRENNCCDQGYCQPWNAGYYQCRPSLAMCPTQETDIDYYGFDLETIRGLQPGECCDRCYHTGGCSAYTFVNENPDGQTACYLKTSAFGRRERKGAVSGQLQDTRKAQCKTPVWGSCGNERSGPGCCPENAICQPWNSGFFQCVPRPDNNKCPTVEVGVDFWGNDIDVKYGLLPGTCCDACYENKECHFFTFVNENPDGRSACYLKSRLGEKKAKASAVSGYRVKIHANETPTPQCCALFLVPFALHSFTHNRSIAVARLSAQRIEEEHENRPSLEPAMSVQYAQVPAKLVEVGGLVIRQKTQKLEALAQAVGLPYEASNEYTVSLLPTNKVVKNHPKDPDGWEPSEDELKQLDTFLFAREESDCCERTLLTFLNCRGLRSFKMHFTVDSNSGDVYLIDRKFHFGGWCCDPLEMQLNQVDNGQGRVLGRVREDYAPYLSRCIASCCACTTYTDIERMLPDGSYEKRYTLRTNTACCGRVNNCCGATCLQNDMVFDILDTKGEIVAHLQNTYGRGSGCGAFCRMCFGFNNYVLEFPRDSTAEDRMLLVTALFQVEYQLFEQQDDNDNNSSS
ncbi:TPA: hypothetical protein N0F65_007615 [Lagenidium giganteum]|uniref:Apple domain-containing protein n=1 Tax=Lagenidium giganteum TaxID=4803 RepID=A0AAV2ZF03_9STRA|nr:TPA: hypothetical protein N0F65_007615 [Lagenidium giganteum]